MKLKGQVLGEPEPIVVVFSRGEQDFVFKVKAVYDFSDFDKLCSEPKPIHSFKKGQIIDDEYKARVVEYQDRKTDWAIVSALSVTEDLEWDEIMMDNPETWSLWRKELTEAGLTNGELAHLIDQVNKVNSIDEKKMEEARERFSVSQEAAKSHQ